MFRSKLQGIPELIRYNTAWHCYLQILLSICTHVLQYDCFSPGCILLTACNPVDPVYSSQMLANVEWSAEWLFCAMLLQF